MKPRIAFLILAGAAACRHVSRGGNGNANTVANSPLSLAADAQMVAIPAGDFVSGSTPEERAQAYDDFEHTSGKDTARKDKWFESEDDRRMTQMPSAFAIDLLPVTQGQYAEFVAAGGAAPPQIDEAGWKVQGFQQDYATVVARDVWKNGQPPVGRAEHPVTLVTWRDAAAYCGWRGELTGKKRRLPTEHEYEKAARGAEGLWYPWGNVFDPDKLDSAVKGSGDTAVVGQYSAGASAYGVLDLAGNVFEWTATRAANGEPVVKGSAFDDWAGVGRGASRHTRPETARHAIVGFRCATDAADAAGDTHNTAVPPQDDE